MDVASALVSENPLLWNELWYMLNHKSMYQILPGHEGCWAMSFARLESGLAASEKGDH
jgi:hypothetical protein